MSNRNSLSVVNKSVNITEKMILGTVQFGMKYGITNNNGTVTWTIRYDLGINFCEDCEGDPTCDDFDSNITVTLLNPQGATSDPQTVTLIQPVAMDLCP